MENYLLHFVRKLNLDREFTVTYLKDIIKHVLTNKDVLAYVEESLNRKKQDEAPSSTLSSDPSPIIEFPDDDDDDTTEEGELLLTPEKLSPVKAKLLEKNADHKKSTESPFVEKVTLSKSSRCTKNNAEAVGYSHDKSSLYKSKSHSRHFSSPGFSQSRNESLSIKRNSVYEKVRKRYSSPRKSYHCTFRHYSDRVAESRKATNRRSCEKTEKIEIRSPRHRHDKASGGVRGNHKLSPRHSIGHKRTSSEHQSLLEGNRVPKKQKIPEKLEKPEEKLKSKVSSPKKLKEISSGVLKAVSIDHKLSTGNQQVETDRQVPKPVSEIKIVEVETKNESAVAEAAVFSPAKVVSETGEKEHKVGNSADDLLGESTSANFMLKQPLSDSVPLLAGKQSSSELKTQTEKSEDNTVVTKNVEIISSDNVACLINTENVDNVASLINTENVDKQKPERSQTKRKVSPRKYIRNVIVDESDILPFHASNTVDGLKDVCDPSSSKKPKSEISTKSETFARRKSPRKSFPMKAYCTSSVESHHMEKSITNSLKVSIKLNDIGEKCVLRVTELSTSKDSKEIENDTKSDIIEKNRIPVTSDENVCNSSSNDDVIVLGVVSSNKVNPVSNDTEPHLQKTVESDECKGREKVELSSTVSKSSEAKTELVSTEKSQETLSNEESKKSSAETLVAPSIIKKCPADTTENWTREEDREILLTCRKFGANIPAFQMVANSNTSKTVEQIKERFYHLIAVFQKALESQKQRELVK